jgi:Rps23 Pro-64 3,4-dihydroxylase Tpa1-like proline 4-hydroxylase
MSDNLKDILSNLNKDIEQEKLLDYLNKKLSAAEAHEVEKQMADDEFMNDAVEGLENFKNKKDLSLLVEQLNNDLKKQTAKKKKKKEKRRLRDQPWLYITVIILLLLVVISFVLIKKYLNQ